MDCGPPGLSVHGILQASILECAAIPSSRKSSQPRGWTRVLMSPALAGGFFTTGSTWEDRTDLSSCFWILFFRVSFCGFLNFFLTDSFPHLSWLFHTWVPSAKLLFIVSSLVSCEAEAELWSLKKMLRHTVFGFLKQNILPSSPSKKGKWSRLL